MRRLVLIEDNADDEELTIRALQRNHIANELTVLRDGQEALDYIFGAGSWAGRPVADLPELILLDLNLPKRDGRQVLEDGQNAPGLRRSPVVVLSTSEAEEDVLRSYDLHANAYVTKPVDFNRFIEVVRQIDEFFVTVVKLPGHVTPSGS